MNSAASLVAESAELPQACTFDADLASDAHKAEDYFAETASRLRELGSPAERGDAARGRAQWLKAQAQAVREAFLRRHIAAIYDLLTDGMTKEQRVPELLYAAAERFPGLVPARATIDAERALRRQSAKEGHEIDQGLFIAHLLAEPRCGLHLVHVMLRPKREALERLDAFVRSGVVDLGRVRLERRGRVGQVELTNPDFLNAEDDAAAAALETAVDLVLLDDQIEVGVLRGGLLQHPKYQGRRVFNAGINLTHVYYGQISFAEFILDRELGLLNKLYRGHWRTDTYNGEFEDLHEKPWLAAVESFAIGGGCQLLCCMDRVIAEPGSYFNLPASKEGFIPGSANLRLPRLVGIQKARHGIFFEQKFEAGTPDGSLICDEVVARDEMDEAIQRNAKQMVAAGMTSTVSNRRALRVGQEPLDVYRRYMATYSRQQAFCIYDQALISNLERSWKPEQRRF
jgi:thioesterase DpgC